MNKIAILQIEFDDTCLEREARQGEMAKAVVLSEIMADMERHFERVGDVCVKCVTFIKWEEL